MKKLFLYLIPFMFAACNPDMKTKSLNIDSLAAKPPMGWNSWLSYGTDVREDEVKAVADYMAANLKQYGWEYIVIDMAWYGKEKAIAQEYYKARPSQTIDEYGRLTPDTSKFPSAKGGKGFGPLADYVHSKGLKFGIHIMRGIPYSAAETHTRVLHTSYFADDITLYDEGCSWYDGMRKVDMNHPGGQAYYTSIVELYDSWGVDFIKADDMQQWPYHTKEVDGIHNAIEIVGRPMILSLSPGGPPFYDRNHPIKYANMYRITGDLWDTWKAVYDHFDVCKQYELYQKPSHWADCDLMPLGKINIRSESGNGERDSRLTKDEQRTLVTLWCIFRSPLFLSNNMALTDSFTLSLITNKEVLDVDQNSTNNKLIFMKDSSACWIADVPNSTTTDKYVAVFNTSSKQKEIKVILKDMTIEGEINVRDLWKHEDLGKMKDEIKVKVNPHGAMMLKITK
jgi:alpha-galactosidase